MLPGRRPPLPGREERCPVRRTDPRRPGPRSRSRLPGPANPPLPSSQAGAQAGAAGPEVGALCVGRGLAAAGPAGDCRAAAGRIRPEADATGPGRRGTALAPGPARTVTRKAGTGQCPRRAGPAAARTGPRRRRPKGGRFGPGRAAEQNMGRAGWARPYPHGHHRQGPTGEGPPRHMAGTVRPADRAGRRGARGECAVAAAFSQSAGEEGGQRLRGCYSEIRRRTKRQGAEVHNVCDSGREVTLMRNDMKLSTGLSSKSKCCESGISTATCTQT